MNPLFVPAFTDMHLPRPGLVAAGFCLFLALLLTLGPQLQRAFDPNLTVLRSLLLKAGVGPEYEADEALEAYAQTVASSAYLYATSVIEMAIAEHSKLNLVKVALFGMYRVRVGIGLDYYGIEIFGQDS